MIVNNRCIIHFGGANKFTVLCTALLTNSAVSKPAV